MEQVDYKAVMAKDIRVSMYTDELALAPRTPFNIQSAIQSLTQEYGDLTGEWPRDAVERREAPHESTAIPHFALFHISPNGVKWCATADNPDDLEPPPFPPDEEAYFVVVPIERIIPADSV